jgi:hypothetical protein
VSRPKPVDATPAQISAAKFIQSAIPCPSCRFSFCALQPTHWSAAAFRRLSQKNSQMNLNLCLQTEYPARFGPAACHSCPFDLIEPISHFTLRARPRQR